MHTLDMMLVCGSGDWLAGDANNLNNSGKFLLQLCYNNALCIINKHMSCRDLLGQWSLIDFCVISADLLQSLKDVRVNGIAELSTDHHLVVCN